MRALRTGTLDPDALLFGVVDRAIRRMAGD